MKQIISDIRSYLAVRLRYPKRYALSKILSPIPSEIRIKEPVEIKKGVLLSSKTEEIGAYTYIGDDASIFECKNIGNFCSISHGAKIGVSNHPLNLISTNAYFYLSKKNWLQESYNNDQESKFCTIEHDVLISANAIILNGVKLATGCVIGAGAFVNTDIPPYAIAVGCPAKVIAYRFEQNVIDKLLESAWWLKPHNELIELSQWFNNPEIFVEKIRHK